LKSLVKIGWSPDWASAFESNHVGVDGLTPARVIEEHRGSWRVMGAPGARSAEVSGRLAYEAVGGEDLPAVGDWVAIAARASEARATIHAVLPRRTALIRKTPDRATTAQVLAANIDFSWIVTSANRDFNPRRIERTVALVREAGAEPIVVLSKCDLMTDARDWISEARTAAPDTAVVAVSAHSGWGIDALATWLREGQTGVLIGSSGVGKSSLVNRLAGSRQMATRDVRSDDDKGRHTTTHRQLVEMPGGGVLIDTPGLRELALWDVDASGVEEAFPEIAERASTCRFRDCQHRGEPGCAVQEAISNGEIDPTRLASLGKLEREAQRIAAQRDGRARHEERKAHKRFSKMVRRTMKDGKRT
jgi:ribosome biogenesis GTPase